MTSVRVLITDREMNAIVACWALYEVEREQDRPDDYARTMAALTRLKSKWYKAKDAADARSVIQNGRRS